MNLEKIILNNFRNYEEQKIELEKGINVFYGDNAQGKTNILEAIYISSMGKSFRTRKEKEVINFEKKYSTIDVEFQKKDRKGNIKVEINDNKKNIFLNSIKVNKLSEIIGNINIVMFSPDDINILKNGPANRRRFLDIMISQLRPAYVYHLNAYLKTLEQRNYYLRQMNCENKSKEFISIWDEKLAEHAEKVFEYRKEFIEKIKGKINNFHQKITNEKEEVKIKYISSCENKEIYLENLKKNLDIDIKRGYTSLGVHKDDFIMYINKKQINIYGSQGQHRTAILSLKLSELEIVYDEIEEYPILLLDDFMSELDNKRIENFLKNMKETQVIITCTDKMEIKDLNGKLFKVREGKVQEIKIN